MVAAAVFTWCLLLEAFCLHFSRLSQRNASSIGSRSGELASKTLSARSKNAPDHCPLALWSAGLSIRSDGFSEALQNCCVCQRWHHQEIQIGSHTCPPSPGAAEQPIGPLRLLRRQKHTLALAPDLDVYILKFKLKVCTPFWVHFTSILGAFRAKKTTSVSKSQYLWMCRVKVWVWWHRAVRCLHKDNAEEKCRPTTNWHAGICLKP